MQVGIGDEITIIGSTADVETIAVGSSVRQMERLTKAYGRGRWRKRKGRARVRLPDGVVCMAELPWYEAHGVGRKEMKVKRILRFE
jgi:hypothetical protein